METTALVGAGMVLLLTVCVGIVAHELSHAAVLYLLGIKCDIAIGPRQVETGQFSANVSGAWAAVTPRQISPGTSPWAMRLSSIAPLLLAVPFVTIGAGIAPDPFQAGNPFLVAATIGWLACAIPSPQDFSVFWHAKRVIAEHTAESFEG